MNSEPILQALSFLSANLPTPLSPLIQASSRKCYSGSDMLIVDSKKDEAEVIYYSRSRITCWSFDGTPCIVLLSRFLKGATENSTLLLSRVDHIYDRKERSRFSSATVVCKLFLNPISELSSVLFLHW